MKKEKLTIQNFLLPDEITIINKTIADAEELTSGEIKLLVVNKSTWMSLSSLKLRIAAARKRAMREFIRLGLDHAVRGTGILVMISLKERVVVVEGGKALEGKLTQDAWERVRDLVISGISSGQRKEGICAAIGEAGQILAKHFPITTDDIDEISNEIVFKE